MLGNQIAPLGAQFAATLERYLSETLHTHIRVSQTEIPANLPTFLTRAYAFFEADILGRRCIFMGVPELSATPGDTGKHIRLAEDKIGALVALATPAMSAHHRARLIQQGVPFAVPGNQLYLPQLAIDLREFFRMAKRSNGDSLSPAAQAVLFDHMLGRDETGGSPSQIAKRLGYSAMSIGRAFDDLATSGLAQVETRGKCKFLVFAADGQKLLDEATPRLRSPVRSFKYVTGRNPAGFLKHAGESALALLSDLTAPDQDVFAVASADWRAVTTRFDLEETEAYAADFQIESWSYDPAGLTSTNTVDPLSLYAQFHDHPDERVSMAAEDVVRSIL
jgi:DNA-binding MarR family transcriptional regulator